MIKRMRRIEHVLPLIILMVVFLATALWVATLSAPNAEANGESLQIFRGPGGPYEIIVGVLPHKPKVGLMHLSVSVLDPETGRPVDKAVVMIIANDTEGEPTYQSPALQNPAEPQFYEANISFFTPGQWSLLVKVDTEQKGYGEATVPIHISPTSLNPGPEGLVVLSLIVFGISGGVIYLGWSSRRKRAATLSR
ncbi:MAG: hypothetical protein BZY79_00240 [SAR202 cluster bacterium Casp-Chloro-G4]|nr:MAG: hypothetical protein BZY79_00240 [SAR202 cluster bacterium Casp-Chloro-G4]